MITLRSSLILSVSVFAASGLSAQECPNAQGLQAESSCSETAVAQQVIEQRVNTFTYSTQHEQALDIAPNGNILVAWGSRRQEAGSYGVFAQLLDPLGRAIGTELHINEYLPGGQKEPAVAYAPNGDAFLAWCSQGGQDGQAGGIYLRKLSQLAEAQGANHFGPVGSEIPVNQGQAGDQVHPTMAISADGKVMVAWVSQTKQGTQTYARIFDGDGQALGDEFRLATGSAVESLPTLAVLESGFVAVWAQCLEDGRTPDGIYARTFSSAGVALADVQKLAGDGAIEPSIDSNGKNAYAVAWMSPKTKTNFQVMAQRFKADGSPLGDAWTAPAPAEGSYLNGAIVAMAPDGRHMVAYNLHAPVGMNDLNRRTREVSIQGQRFDVKGLALGEVTRLNQFDEGVQDLTVGRNARHMVWSELDQLAMAWYGTSETDGKGVGLTLFAPDSLQPAAPLAVEPVAALEGLHWSDVQKQMAPPEWDPNWVDDSDDPPNHPMGPGTGFQAFTSTGWNPPDPDLAVGPNNIVAVVNVDMRFFDKDGTQTFNTALEPWFGTTGFVFDPVALYDAKVDRFIVAAIEHDGNVDMINMAISDDGDPNGTWYKYRFNVDSICGFIDFDNLGVSDDAYFLVADCFGGGGNFIHVMNKAPMLNGNPVTLVSVNTTSGIISNGATRNYDDEGTGYFASTFARGSPYLKLYSVEDPTGTAILRSFNLDVGAFSSPPDAAQLGTSNRADTIDHRIKNGVKRDGFLYLVHNVARGSVARCRWYKIDVSNWPGGGSPILVDSGYVNPGADIYTWFGDINVDALGNMAIAYNRSSSSEYISVERTWRAAADTPGAMRDFVQLVASTSPETGSRWGDYSGLEEDPSNPSTFYNHHEYREASWRTWIDHFTIGDTYVLSLNAPNGLVSNTTATVDVTGSGPGVRNYLFNGTGLGVTNVAPGVDLEIANGVQIMNKLADAAGNTTFSRFLPASLAGFNVWLQVVDGNGDLSNVWIDTIQ
jgi:hypothetical protein